MISEKFINIFYKYNIFQFIFKFITVITIITGLLSGINIILTTNNNDKILEEEQKNSLLSFLISEQYKFGNNKQQSILDLISDVLLFAHEVAGWLLFILLYVYLGWSLYHRKDGFNKKNNIIWMSLVLIFLSLLLGCAFSLESHILPIKQAEDALSRPIIDGSLISSNKFFEENNFITYKKRILFLNPNIFWWDIGQYYKPIKFILIHTIFLVLIPLVIGLITHFLILKTNVQIYNRWLLPIPIKFDYYDESTVLIKKKSNLIVFLLVSIVVIFIFYYVNVLKILIVDIKDTILLLNTPQIYKAWYSFPFYAMLKGFKKTSVIFTFFLMVFFHQNFELNVKLFTKRTWPGVLHRFIFCLIVLNFFLLGWAGGVFIISPTNCKYMALCKFLSFMQAFLLFIYGYSTIPLRFYRRFLAPQPKAEIDAANPYLKKKSKEEILDEEIKSKIYLVADERTLILWWIFLIFTIPGVELYFMDDASFVEMIKFIFRKTGIV